MKSSVIYSVYQYQRMTTQLILRLQQQNKQLRDRYRQRCQQQCSCTSKHQQNEKKIRILMTNQQTLKHQISLLKDSLCDMDQSQTLLNQQYNNQRQQNLILQQQHIRMQQQLQQQTRQKQSIVSAYLIKQQSLTEQCNIKINDQVNRIAQIAQQYEQKLNRLEEQLMHKQQLYCNVRNQYGEIKKLLEMESRKRKNKQKQYEGRINQVQQQLKICKQRQIGLKRQVNQKIALIIQKDGIIKSLQKSMRQINNKASKIEKQADRKIFREKSVTKKAMQGLQMMRKYSQLQLNKSRKKQKMQIKDNKQLVSKIKQITTKNQNASSRDNSFISTASYRKTSLPLNSTKSNGSFIIAKNTKKNSLKLTSHIYKQTQPKNSLKYKKNEQSTTGKGLMSNTNSQKYYKYRFHNNNMSKLGHNNMTGCYQDSTDTKYLNKQHINDDSQYYSTNYKQSSPNISNFVLEEQCSQIITNCEDSAIFGQDCPINDGTQKKGHKKNNTDSNGTLLSASKSTPKLQVNQHDTFSVVSNLNSLTCMVNSGISTCTPCFQSAALSRVNHGHKISMFKATTSK